MNQTTALANPAPATDLLPAPAAHASHDLEERLIDFAVSVLNVAESLPDTMPGRHLASQLVRAGTAPAPRYAIAAEGSHAASTPKELNAILTDLEESRVWLRILWKKAYIPGAVVLALIRECEDLVRLLRSAGPPRVAPAATGSHPS